MTFGALYGVTFGLVVFLAKGAKRETALHLLGISVIQGLATGLLIALLAMNTATV